jgi:hypothetical protein
LFYLGVNDGPAGQGASVPAAVAADPVGGGERAGEVLV